MALQNHTASGLQSRFERQSSPPRGGMFRTYWEQIRLRLKSPRGRLMVEFIILNAFTALWQMCAAIFLYSLALADKDISTEFREGIVLVCFSVGQFILFPNNYR
jgi:hypothetical protein